MPNKGRSENKHVTVKVGHVSGTSGNVNIAGGDITTRQSAVGLGATEIKQRFDPLYAAIELRPETSPSDKDDLKAEVKELQSTVTEAARKNEEVDAGLLSRRFRNIARMAPDILDVIVATLGNPLAGLGVAVKKIAEKAKKDVKQG